MSATEQPAEKVEGQLPEGVKEQTKEQFEKLKEHNKELSDKLAKFEQEQQQQQPKFNSVLDELPLDLQAFGNLSAPQVEDLTRSLVDENGYIDQDLLNKTLKEASETKDRLMLQEKRIEEFEINQTVRDVHSKHPALDPRNPSFNREFYDRVKNEVLTQKNKGYQDFEAAADKVAAELQSQSKSQEQSQKATEEEKQKVISQREQASALSTSQGFTESGQYEDIDEGIRKGDNLSIGQKLQANGY